MYVLYSLLPTGTVGKILCYRLASDVKVMKRTVVCVCIAIAVPISRVLCQVFCTSGLRTL